MSTRVDYLIVGSGLTGAVIARMLADQGREVLVLDRREHHGGNVHDEDHASGVRIHTYGPHYFRTSSDRLWDFVRRFAAFHPYEAIVRSDVDGVLQNWPIAESYIREHVGADWRPTFTGEPSNFEEAALSLMPAVVYEKFIKPYNEKQWGVKAAQLDAALCKRFDVRKDDEPRLTPNAKYQGIPMEGYTAFMRKMLEGIDVRLGVDYLQRRDDFAANKMLIFTGPIDEYFGFDLGRLAYRGQHRQHTYHHDADLKQPCGQVNNPQHAGGPHIRTLEWKHMMPSHLAAQIRGTVLTRETPHTPTDPSGYEYPFPNQANGDLYRQYRERADALENVLICGRLGEYRYYDMDQAIARAMVLFERLV